MGMLKKPSLRLYWSTDSILKTPFLTAFMARDRYFQIRTYLHFADNQEKVKDRDSSGYDNKLFKIVCCLAVNETNKIEGKVYFRQFIAIKPRQGL